MFRKIYLTAVILIFAIFFSSVSSYAQVDEKQPKKIPDEIATKIADILRKELQLSDTQYDEVYEIFVNHITQVQADREKYGKEDSDERKNAIMERRKNLRSELENVLSDEQMEKLKELRKKRREHNRTGPDDNPKYR